MHFSQVVAKFVDNSQFFGVIADHFNAGEARPFM
jgi:hypothetical protein